MTPDQLPPTGRHPPARRLAVALMVIAVTAMVVAALPWVNGLETAGAASPVGPATTVAPGACGDLIIAAVDISPERPSPGTPVTVNVTFRNQGDAAVAGFHVALYLDPAPEPPLSTTHPEAQIFFGLPLKPGQEGQLTGGSLTFPAAGNHVLYAWADPGGLVAECDEGNNLAGPVTLRVDESPDAFEHDNACDQASPITTDGALQEHNLSPETDEDWVTFQVSAGASYQVQALPIGGDADPVLDLYSACDRLTFSAGPQFTFVAWATGPMHLRVRQ